MVTVQKVDEQFPGNKCSA